MSEVIPASNASLMSFIERASRDDTFSVEKFEVLLRLQMEVGDKQARRAFNAAMAEAQSEMQPVVRDAENTHLRNRYARLETIDASIRPIITAHGFSVRFGSAPAPRDGELRITCTVAHRDGYFEEQYLDAPAGATGKNTAVTPVQAVGSTITYLRRYLLCLAFNVTLSDDDDDGEAMRRTAAAATPRAERVYEAQQTNSYHQGAIDGWQAAFDKQQTTEAVRKLEGSMRYTAAMANAPAPIVEALRAMCARAYTRVQPPATAEATATVGNAPENDPWSDTAPAIVGEKYAAG